MSFCTAFVQQVLSVDPSLGRLDYDSLSDQALMEMLIEPMEEEEKDTLKDGHGFSKGNFLDVCEWECIECTDDRVTHVDISEYDFTKKRVPFEFIPPLVKRFKLSDCKAHGTVDTSSLPKNLETFEIDVNDLEGSLNFKGFPRKLRLIDISENYFSGSCALSDLPDSLTDFIAYENNLSGEITLNALPAALKNLILSKNVLEGEVHIDSLPSSIGTINLSDNAFSGEFRLLSLPSSLEKINISKNPLDETAVLLRSDKDRHFWIFSADIMKIVDEKGDAHPWQAEILEKNYHGGDSDEDSEEDSPYSLYA